MSDVVIRLREMAALTVHPVDVFALCGLAAAEIENLRILYDHACDSCRREAERADRAEARVDELLARLNTRTTGDVEGA